MNPAIVLVLSSFGLGCVVALAIWMVLDEPLRKLERPGFAGTAGRRRKSPKADRLILEFEDSWKSGEPSLDRFLYRLGSYQSRSALAMFVEADLRNRFLRGQKPSAAYYFELYPELVRSTDRVINLVYEEYRLLEKRGEKPDAERFCERYPRWRELLLPRLRDDVERSKSTATKSGL